jgi:hypothetical protein
METVEQDLFDFEDVRPYHASEVPEVIDRLLKNPSTFKMMNYIYPQLNWDDIEEMMREIKSPEDFQAEVSAPAFKVIAQRTTNGLTFTNMDRIEKDQAYLFLSNHRDIILDSALLNVSLLEKGYQTTQIAIGDNLLQNSVIEDLVRLNKSFIVHRNINPKEFLFFSKRLSHYIRKTVCEDNTSVWIAHKEGRSKDGDDRTASGLLKMLISSTKLEIEVALRGLNIVPTVVSYEYDPCDIYKANELILTKEQGLYEKSKGEDYKSAMKGITGHKGRVNIAVGRVLDHDLDQLQGFKNKNEKLRVLSNEIDRRMHLLYKLWPSNYIAYDVLMGESTYSDEYSRIQKITFRNYIRGRVLKLALARKKIANVDSFAKQAKDTLLQMYANPVINMQDALKATPFQLPAD